MSKYVKTSATEACFLATPSDANTIGSIFGGRIMEWMDMTAAICARRHSNLRVATVAVENLQFLRPLQVGLVIKILASVNRAFGSSMEVGIKVIGEDTYRDEAFHAASAYFTIVGLDEAGKPAKVPELIAETDLERRRWDEAGLRRKNRNTAKNGSKSHIL